MTLQGEFTDHVEFDQDETIQGSVTGGATVRPGLALVVQGHLTGVVMIGEGATLTIHGSFGGDVHRNDGLLLVAGLMTVDPQDIPGMVTCFAGTLLTTGPDVLLLGEDGSLNKIGGGTHSNVTVNAGTEHAFVFSKEQGAFLPIRD
ncbi:hypothetical protein [Aeromicrobium ginsengisoli]|uniref:Polymer-forming cytoskeletal protein n=1 Tax=Aeromicrobium ginsengisoli TaxID=363867 RepID=A0A5M4FES0_9ACTN|nr:hypothetical protein [Aeromicrobium ginsengisoli]KAA1397784.1 hypothetical protein ESP70_010585 [Aeromicrobium ginsengisoli]